MKTIYLQLALLILLSLNLAKESNAQYVTIPDTNFRNYLTKNFSSCINNGQLDTTCPAALSKTRLNLEVLGIADLTGVQYFKRLDTLICYINKLSSLPPLPDSLTYLQCDNNKITSLPALPATLTYLGCSYNKLTSLPNLPGSLTFLDVGTNNISALPTLPNSLVYLTCENNNLTTLPVLPNSLSQLQCQNNNLRSGLPALPNSLTFIQCYSDSLTSLPALPDSLINIECNNNNITQLPALPAKLLQLYCSFNKISCLPTLPEGLNVLSASNNPILCIPNLPASVILYSNVNSDTTYPICSDTYNPNNCSVQSATAVASATIQNNLQIYPNPSTGTVTINYPTVASGIKVCGMDGRTVYETSNGSSNYTLNLADNLKGLYMVQVYTQQGVITQKLVFE